MNQLTRIIDGSHASIYGSQLLVSAQEMIGGLTLVAILMILDHILIDAVFLKQSVTKKLLVPMYGLPTLLAAFLPSLDGVLCLLSWFAYLLLFEHQALP